MQTQEDQILQNGKILKLTLRFLFKRIKINSVEPSISGPVFSQVNTFKLFSYTEFFFVI